MPIPTQSEFNHAVLIIAAERGEELDYAQLLEALREKFSLTQSEMEERYPESGDLKVRKIAGRAAGDLRRAELLDSPKNGVFRINRNGREFLEIHRESGIRASLLRDLYESASPYPTRRRIRRQILARYSARYSRNPTNPSLLNDENYELDDEDDEDYELDDEDDEDYELDDEDYEDYELDDEDIDETDYTPGELIAEAYENLQNELADDMLDELKSVEPYHFERLVVALLENMGYGEGRAVGRSGDGGIDGVINQDPLGLEKVYIQAKRWQNTVGEPEIRNFSGSLMARGASKGVFITTSDFSGAARQTAQTISAGSQLIRLINGQELARLMIQHGVGVVTEITYEVKKLDENYFSDSDDI